MSWTNSNEGGRRKCRGAFENNHPHDQKKHPERKSQSGFAPPWGSAFGGWLNHRTFKLGLGTFILRRDALGAERLQFFTKFERSGRASCLQRKLPKLLRQERPGL